MFRQTVRRLAGRETDIDMFVWVRQTGKKTFICFFLDRQTYISFWLLLRADRQVYIFLKAATLSQSDRKYIQGRWQGRAEGNKHLKSTVSFTYVCHFWRMPNQYARQINLQVLMISHRRRVRKPMLVDTVDNLKIKICNAHNEIPTCQLPLAAAPCHRESEYQLSTNLPMNLFPMQFQQSQSVPPILIIMDIWYAAKLKSFRNDQLALHCI